MPSYLGKLSLTLFEGFWGSFPKKWLAPTVRFQGSQWGNGGTSENGTSNSKHSVGHSTAPARQIPFFSLWEGKRFCLSKGGGGVGRYRKEGDKGMMREEWSEISISCCQFSTKWSSCLPWWRDLGSHSLGSLLLALSPSVLPPALPAA